MQLADTHVLITGGSKGIGAAIARQLHARGARLSLLARPSPELTSLCGELQAQALPCDLGDLANVEGLVEKAEAAFGPLGIHVNNAALQIPGALADLDAATMRQQLNVNFMSPMELTRQAVRGMRDRGSGTVCTVGSLAGEYALPHLPCYGSSKAGLLKMSMDLMREMDGQPIDVCHFLVGAVPGTQLNVLGKEDPVISRMEQIFLKMPTLTPEQVATSIVKRLAKGGDKVVTLPWHAAPLTAIRMIPIHVADSLFRKELAKL